MLFNRERPQPEDYVPDLTTWKCSLDELALLTLMFLSADVLFEKKCWLGSRAFSEF